MQQHVNKKQQADTLRTSLHSDTALRNV